MRRVTRYNFFEVFIKDGIRFGEDQVVEDVKSRVASVIVLGQMVDDVIYDVFGFTYDVVPFAGVDVPVGVEFEVIVVRVKVPIVDGTDDG